MPLAYCPTCDRLVALAPLPNTDGVGGEDWWVPEHDAPDRHAGCGGELAWCELAGGERVRACVDCEQMVLAHEVSRGDRPCPGGGAAP